MKSILHLKFIVLYIIFGFLCVFTTATLTNELIMDGLEEDISQSLYREATLISNNYLPSYFSEDSSIWAVQSQLIAMRLYLNSRILYRINSTLLLHRVLQVSSDTRISP